MSENSDLLALEVEKDARIESDAVYEAAKTNWENFDAQYQTMRGGAHADGDTIARIAALVRRYGPKLLTRMGWPGAAAGVAALVADEGAFSGIINAFKSVLELVF